MSLLERIREQRRAAARPAEPVRLAPYELAPDYRTADDWPEPYGPDPVVFGAEPRYKQPIED